MSNIFIYLFLIFSRALFCVQVLPRVSEWLKRGRPSWREAEGKQEESKDGICQLVQPERLGQSMCSCFTLNNSCFVCMGDLFVISAFLIVCVCVCVQGMACVGRTKQCTIVPSNHYGPVPGVPVGTLWKFRVQVSWLCISQTTYSCNSFV